MESVHSQKQEQLKDLSAACDLIAEGKGEKITRVDRAKKLAQEVADAAKNLDKAVIATGQFFNELLDAELMDDVIDEQQTKQGILHPSDHPLGIPDSASEENMERFEKAQHVVVTSLDSELRREAMFLMSLCSSLIFERGLLDQELFRSREARRKAIGEIMKISLRNGKVTLRR